MSEEFPPNDTIAAVATPAGRGAIGIVRVSGPRAVEIASRLLRGRQDPAQMATHTLALGWIEYQGERLDQVLCLVMRAPQSYTKEDVVEFQCHGGPVTRKAVLAAVIAQGARPARPGEFTRRAFLAGRIDLAQAEAVADLVAGETETAARLAAAQLEGGLSTRLASLRAGLAETLALLEAGIDFADEEDVVAIETAELMRRLAAAENELSDLLADAGRGRRYREGARVVIAGKPNVGKSTLMNRLLRADRVIVTPAPGTTRDVIEDAVDIKGIPVRLFDTAGIGAAGDEAENMDEAENIGVTRAREALRAADLVLFMIDASRPIGREDEEIAKTIEGPIILVANKCDLPSVVDGEALTAIARENPIIRTSALGGQGIGNLEDMTATILTGNEPSMEDPIVSNARHARALEKARQDLIRAREAANKKMSPEFVAQDLGSALQNLGEITGETVTNEILDIIFNRFCVGK